MVRIAWLLHRIQVDRSYLCDFNKPFAQGRVQTWSLFHSFEGDIFDHKIYLSSSRTVSLFLNFLPVLFFLISSMTSLEMGSWNECCGMLLSVLPVYLWACGQCTLFLTSTKLFWYISSHLCTCETSWVI